MTHVVHPYSHRLGIIRDWKSRWFGKDTNQYVDHLRADVLVRAWLTKRLKGMYLSLIEIERTEKQYRIMIHTSRPGMIIGRGGDGIEKLRAALKKEMARLKIIVPQDVKLDIIEVTSPEADAAIVAAMIVEGIEKRLPFRRVLKTTIEKIMANRDAQGSFLFADPWETNGLFKASAEQLIAAIMAAGRDCESVLFQAERK
jgi:small subunit ribosomal protein S3